VYPCQNKALRPVRGTKVRPDDITGNHDEPASLVKPCDPALWSSDENDVNRQPARERMAF
jgi:hypothetical protein